MSGLTILIEGTRIIAVGPQDSVQIPELARFIDGAGKWVTPGFVDVHTHSAPPAVLQRALALGITTIQGMRVYVHVTQLVDAEQAVATDADVFIHGVMDAALPDRLWNRMREQRLVWAPAIRIVAAGADRAGYARRVLADPFLKESLSLTELDAYTADVARTEPAGDEPFPGLVPHGTRYLRVLYENTRQAQAHGVPVAVGSDAGVSGNGPGIGTHVEMELLQDAGLTPAEVIVAATFAGARAVGVDDELGTVAPGKVADLVILNLDPLTDIRNARAIEWIIKGGRVMRSDQLLPTTRSSESALVKAARLP